MRAAFWTLVGILVVAAIATGIWLIVVHNNAENQNKGRACESASQGDGKRVYVKYGVGGYDVDNGTYCVYIFYKE